ncbi:MAG: GNAT family N-acetyltransferase [Devosia sp.]|nr:GNAT family N-acetyltransferase [Devosia sp.]
MIPPRSAPAPVRRGLEGRYTRLEPLAACHAADLLAAVSVADLTQRFAYLPADPPDTVAGFEGWIAQQAVLSDPILFAVIDRATGRAGGWQQLMRIEPQHGVVEIGYIYWGPTIARTRLATEALYLFARHVFDDLGYRRFEWKCNDRNEPSKRAARRFGFTFEGVFRQHMIVRGENRDTAWFSMLDGEWPARRAAFERWLDPGNFDAEGRQKLPLRHDPP